MLRDVLKGGLFTSDLQTKLLYFSSEKLVYIYVRQMKYEYIKRFVNYKYYIYYI